MRFKLNILLCAVAALPIAGCNDAKKTENGPGNDDSTKSVAPEAESRPAAAPAAQPAPQGLIDPLRGAVKETMDSNGYTYVLLDTAQGEVWAAARQFAVVVGAEVEVAGLSTMLDFHSPSLDRTFKEIQFVGAARVVGADALTSGTLSQNPAQSLPPGHPPLGAAAGAPSGAAPSAGAATEKVEPLQGGVTVAELFEKRADLKDTVVKFRGRVVKANQGIMGLNWMHIQDGTGEPGTNDITATSKEGYAPVGSVVTIEGTLALDRDFGAGYAYEVIVEGAKIIPGG